MAPDAVVVLVVESLAPRFVRATCWVHKTREEPAHPVYGGIVASETEDVRQYIEEASYPARAQDLLAAARSSDAPEGVLERLEQLPTNA